MKVTPDHVRSLVDHSQFHRFKGTTTTVCCITLKNGHTTIGTSACADPDEFNTELGQKLAYDDALSKIYALEAYLLSETMHQDQRATNAERAFNERSTDVNSTVSEFLDMILEGRGIDPAEKNELEFPDLNIEIEERDNRVFSLVQAEREWMQHILNANGEVIRHEDGHDWRLVELCEEGGIFEYVGVEHEES